MKRALTIILIVLFADQLLKFWVKTHMHLGEEFSVLGNWFIIHFTENKGMAFGLEFAGENGKLFLSLFRIVAVIAIGYYLVKLLREESPRGLISCIALIMAGALGNIIDSAFYGIIFNDSYNQVASLFPQEGGYSSFLHGDVVDMLYFPILNGTFPDWFPFWGGEDFTFFRPVFNIADSSITVGVSLIIIFQKRYFSSAKTKKQETGAASQEVVTED